MHYQKKMYYLCSVNHLAKMSPKKEKQPRSISRAVFGAVGESRTHTPQRALPPQSSVSTISPLPQMDWECKVNAKM